MTNSSTSRTSSKARRGIGLRLIIINEDLVRLSNSLKAYANNMHTSSNESLHVVGLDPVERLPDEGSLGHGHVIGDEVEALLLVMGLHNGEDILDGIVLGRVRDVPDDLEVQVKIELLVCLGLVNIEIVLEDDDPVGAALDSELPEEAAVCLAVDGALVDEQVLDAADCGDGSHGGEVISIDIRLVQLEVLVLVTVIPGLDRLLGERDLVRVDDLDALVDGGL